MCICRSCSRLSIIYHAVSSCLIQNGFGILFGTYLMLTGFFYKLKGCLYSVRNLHWISPNLLQQLASLLHKMRCFSWTYISKFFYQTNTMFFPYRYQTTYIFHHFSPTICRHLQVHRWIHWLRCHRDRCRWEHRRGKTCTVGANSTCFSWKEKPCLYNEMNHLNLLKGGGYLLVHQFQGIIWN